MNPDDPVVANLLRLADEYANAAADETLPISYVEDERAILSAAIIQALADVRAKVIEEAELACDRLSANWQDVPPNQFSSIRMADIPVEDGVTLWSGGPVLKIEKSKGEPYRVWVNGVEYLPAKPEDLTSAKP